MPVVRIRSVWLGVLLTSLWGAAPVQGQPTPEPPKVSSLKLPDGTIVFLTKSPDDPNPPIEGVVLSAADYKSLSEKAEQAKKTKVTYPSRLEIRVLLESRGDRSFAALTLEYGFRTVQPRSLVALGCHRASITSAKNQRGQLPILNPPGEEGLTVLVEEPGEHKLVLQADVPVGPRGPKNEIGFDLNLPRAAITTLVWVEQTAHRPNKFNLGTRLHEAQFPKSGEVKTSSIALESLTKKPYPLGATDILELTWEQPSSPGLVEPNNTLDAEITVRIDETSVETVAKILLAGPGSEWPLQLPPNAELTVERSKPRSASVQPVTIVRPPDASKAPWRIQVPIEKEPSEWIATATVRQLRPKPSDPKSKGPYAVGPFYSPAAARHRGKIRISAHPNVRLGFKPLSDVRRVELPQGADEDLIALFQFSVLPVPAASGRALPLVELEARPSPSVARVRPTHKFRLNSVGWQLDTIVRVTPPPRGEMEQLIVEMPGGWQKRLEASPEEIVDSVQVLKDDSSTVYAIRFLSPQKQPFEITVSSTYPVAAGSREVSIPLPRFPQGELRESKVVAGVADGLEIRGVGTATEPGLNSSEPLKPANKAPNGSTTIQGDFERGLERVDLAWQAYRPELNCEIRADITVQDRQTLIAQTIVFKSAADSNRPVRIRGPRSSMIWQQSTPPLDPVDTVGSNEWEFLPPASGGKDFTLTINYAIKHPQDDRETSFRLPLALFWPEAASRSETRVRVWGGTHAYSAELIDGGQWFEQTPEAVPGRDSFPWFSLKTTADNIPLTFELKKPNNHTVPANTVEKAILVATFEDPATATCRMSLLLSRWNGSSVDIRMPPVQTVDATVDGRRIEGLVPGEERILRVPVPEQKPGKTTTIEIRYRASLARGSGRARSFPLPSIQAALLKNPLRWHISAPMAETPLLVSQAGRLDLEWTWHGFGLASRPATTPSDLDQWLTSGTGRETPGGYPQTGSRIECLSGQSLEPAVLEILLVPRPAFVALVSTAVLGIGLMLTRWPIHRIGWALGLVGLGVGVVSVIAPQPTAQFIVASQPGWLVLATFLSGKWAIVETFRRRANRLPAFSGTPPTQPVDSIQGQGSRPAMNRAEAVAGPRSHSARKE
jgi:hypothetical protein